MASTNHCIETSVRLRTEVYDLWRAMANADKVSLREVLSEALRVYQATLNGQAEAMPARRSDEQFTRTYVFEHALLAYHRLWQEQRREQAQSDVTAAAATPVLV